MSVGVYLAVALLLIGPLGMLGLVLADSAKHISHAVTMLDLPPGGIGNLADLETARQRARPAPGCARDGGPMFLALNATTRLGLGQADRSMAVAPGWAAWSMWRTSLIGIDELRHDLVGRRLRLPRLD